VTTNIEVRYFKAWLLFFLIATVGGFVVGAIFGAVVGFTLGVAGMSVEVITLITGALGLIVALPISYFSFRWSVHRYIIPQIKAAAAG
jgi:uncharacterized membrane protein